MSEQNAEEKARGFRLLVESRPQLNMFHEDTDGEQRKWHDLTPAAKLGVIATDAALYQVPVEVFVPVALEFMGAVGIIEAALTTTLLAHRELTEIARHLPDDGRIESVSLPDQVKELVHDLKQAERQLANDHTPER